MSSRHPPSAEGPLGSAIRLLPALAAGAAMAALGCFEVDANGAAETLYLAFVASGVLLAIAALAPPPAVEAVAGAALATAAVWVLPAGPARGAALGFLLVLLFAVAAARRLARTGGALPPAVAVPAAFGLQFLLRGAELLAPPLDFHTLVVFIGLPTAGAVAVSLLARRHGARRALIAGGAALALAPGWNVASTLALVALAGGGWMASAEARDRSWRWLAWPLLLVPVLWEPRSGWCAALAGLALAFPRAALGLAAAAGTAQLLLGGQAPGLAGLSWLALLVPAVVAFRRESHLPAMTALLLAACVPWAPDRSVLAAPLALAALGLAPGWAAAAQGFWTAALLAGSALAAGYPWLRADPLAQALNWTGLGPGSWRAALPAAVVGALWSLERLASRERRPTAAASRVRWSSPRSPAFGAAVAAALVGSALAFHLPSPLVPLLPDVSAVRLTASQPTWEGRLADARARALVVESSLGNGAGLLPGTPVAILVFTGAAPRILRAGVETGEWAARRPDVAAQGARLAPAAWMSSLVDGFFAQRYRARFTLPPGLRRDLPFRIERPDTLPPEVEIALHAVGVER